jgi:hypothetical protein
LSTKHLCPQSFGVSTLKHDPIGTHQAHYRRTRDAEH